MGACATKPKFNKLDYPSYCTMEPATHDDQTVCFETWTRAVRTRTGVDDFSPPDQGKKSFDVLQAKFIDLVYQQGVTTPLPDDFLICLVSTIVYGKTHRAAGFRGYALPPATWSAIGTALFMSVRALHAPFEWPQNAHTAWIRCFGDLMRSILENPSIKAKMSPSAKAPISQYQFRRSIGSLRIDVT